MAREFFKNLPNTTTPLSASKLNGLLDGDEAMGNIVVDSIKGKNIFNINGEVNVKGNDLSYGTLNTVSNNVLTSNYNSANTHGYGQLFTNLNGETITFSAKCVSNGTGYGSLLSIYDNNTLKETLEITNGNTNYITYTCTSNNVVFAFSTRTGTGAQLTDIQVEIGDKKTDYAEYQGIGYVSGSKPNGNYIKYDDGTLIQFGTLNKDLFLQTADVYNTVQGIKFYRSAGYTLYTPVLFIDMNYTILAQPLQGFTSDASRLEVPRTQKVTDGSFDIQLIGVEPFTSSGTGYINLLGVDWIAIGRWK